MGVFDAIRKEWRSIIKTNPSCAPSTLDQTRFELIIAGKKTDLANVTSKLVSESHSFCLLNILFISANFLKLSHHIESSKPR